MQIVDKFEFDERKTRGKYYQLYKDFLGLPHGTAVKFSQGDDFDVEPAKFAITLRTGLWNKGYKAKVSVNGNDVYAIIVGLRPNRNTGGA